jgi:hypothetical protein
MFLNCFDHTISPPALLCKYCGLIGCATGAPVHTVALVTFLDHFKYQNELTTMLFEMKIFIISLNGPYLNAFQNSEDIHSL